VLISRIDDLYREDHAYLEPGDHCLYLREHSPGQGYRHSETNTSSASEPLWPRSRTDADPDLRGRRLPVVRAPQGPAGVVDALGSDVLEDLS
jgi:hypothetical protein